MRELQVSQITEFMEQCIINWKGKDGMISERILKEIFR
jgi:hypothetical protein